MMYDPDVVRVMAVALGAIVFGMTIAVGIFHAKAVRASPRPHSLVSWHVSVITVAHLSYAGGCAYAILRNLNTPIGPVTVLYLIGSVLTVAALGIVLQVQRNRLRQQR